MAAAHRRRRALAAETDRDTCTGQAMEARLYAEDPTTGFLPSTGPLTHLKFPTTSAWIPA